MKQNHVMIYISTNDLEINSYFKMIDFNKYEIIYKLNSNFNFLNITMLY